MKENIEEGEEGEPKEDVDEGETKKNVEGGDAVLNEIRLKYGSKQTRTLT